MWGRGHTGPSLLISVLTFSSHSLQSLRKEGTARARARGAAVSVTVSESMSVCECEYSECALYSPLGQGGKHKGPYGLLSGSTYLNITASRRAVQGYSLVQG